MTDYPYIAPCSYFLIYVYEIPGSVDHAGILKVGDTTIKTAKKASELTVNCAELKAAAKKRIDQQTGTAGVKYILHHAELAVRMTQDGGVKMISPFRDHDVHDVLEKSGYKHVKISGTKGREWYKADLATIKNAIAAVKEGRIALDSSELKKPAPFKFREEQEKAINDTLMRFKKHNDMLWDAKMRFGKTPTALEVVRRGGFRKTIIITHRPVVGSSWEEDFKKIFPRNEVPYSYVDKTKVVAKGYEAKEEADKKDILKKYDKAGKHFIYFASIQDLRGSKRVGGNFFKNDAVFDMAWDLVIVDEAHEGTQTDYGKKVSAELTKNNKKTKVLSLSGTPFNLLPSFDDGAVFEWDYVREQTAKTTWDEKHPNEPNPYAVLPRMNIYTFDLSSDLGGYAEEELEGKAFNFTEFFRTWTGDKDADGRAMPKGVKVGDFIHAEDVWKFLDLLGKPSATSRYPFATPEYCDYFRHSLWMVPGVAAAKALSEMIHNHPCYKTFGVANVAGEGDDYEEEHADDALELVRSVIRRYPRSITLSCGKLTTGVTVPEWTAVLMIAGSVHTAASSYMQTIFRVQSPWVHDGKVKEECYVFDFAPDRALTVIAETAQLSKRISKDKDKEAEGRRALGEFLNFCPVIALEGGKARQFEVNEMMRRLKHVFVMRAIRNGFDDPSIYDNEKLMSLGKLDLKKFNDLEAIVGKSKQTESTNEITINDLGFDQADSNDAEAQAEVLEIVRRVIHSFDLIDEFVVSGGSECAMRDSKLYNEWRQQLLAYFFGLTSEWLTSTLPLVPVTMNMEWRLRSEITGYREYACECTWEDLFSCDLAYQPLRNWILKDKSVLREFSGLEIVYPTMRQLHLLKNPLSLGIEEKCIDKLLALWREMKYKVDLPAAFFFAVRPLTASDIFHRVSQPLSWKSCCIAYEALVFLRGYKNPSDDMVPVPRKVSDHDAGIIVQWNGQNSVINIALANWLTDDASYAAAVCNVADPNELHRFRRTMRLVNAIIASDVRPDYVVFPELSIPPQWFSTIASKLKKSHISLIAGVEYLHEHGAVRNQVWCSLMTDVFGFPDAYVVRFEKVHPAVHEEEELRNRAGVTLTSDVKQSKRVDKPLLVRHGSNKKNLLFSTLICSDLLNVDYRQHLRGDVDLVFVPSWNQDVDLYASLVESTAFDLHAYIAVCNDRKYGDTRIRAPYRENYRRDVVKIKGGESDYFVIGKVDIDALRKFQSYQTSPTGDKALFKPVPIGYKISDGRKILPQ